MKLIYNGVDLAQLGVMRIISHTTQREPAEAPQWERVTYRVRLDFFQQTFKDNFTLVEQLRDALRTQQATLLWQEDSGSKYIERTVTAGDDETTDGALDRGGTYWQALSFQFWFLNHDVATNCLAATYQRTGASTELLNLSTVTGWSERLAITRWDELRSARKLVQGTVNATGRFLGDTKQALATRRTALLALKDKFVNEIGAGASGTLKFGTFNKTIRITEFRAEVDQPHNAIQWSLTATYTAFPNEADYAYIEVRIVQRENLAEGIKYLNLSGRIGAPDAAAANARLALLQSSLVPVGYALLTTETTEPRTITESGKVGGTDTGDGLIVTELPFSIEYRDASSIVCSYQRSADGSPVLDMGTVDGFRDNYSAQLFNDMRSIRRRAGGMVALRGKWYAAESLSDAAKQAALVTRKKQFDTELTSNASGTLIYGVEEVGAPEKLIFKQVVRVVEFSAEINRLRNCIEWGLTGSFTRFPNESNYLVCEFNVGTRQDRVEGIKLLTLTGRIGAATIEAAQAKLAALRASLVPPGYVLTRDGSESRYVSCESDGGSVDGQSFIELTLNDEWHSHAGNILQYTLRRADDDDIKTGFIRTTFSGTIQVSGATSAAAFTTAETQAAALGAGKYPFLVRTSVVELSHQVRTDGLVIVTVEFGYEYQRKGTKIFTEVVAELSEDSFGQSVEHVSGYIAAPTLAIASATYQTDVRNIATYQGALLVNERRPTLAQQRIDTEITSLAALDDRYVFSFQVLRPKGATQTAVQYELTTSSDIQAREKRTIIQGEVFAASESAANAFLDTFLTGLGVGNRVRFDRRVRTQKGPKVVGTGQASVMMGVSFTEEYVALLVGVVDGILESECSEDLLHSGGRVVVKAIPDGPVIIQTPGIQEGRRVVTARAVGTTETACLTWAKGIRAALMDGTYEAPPQITTRFLFLPQVEGVPRGADNNVKVFELNAVFTEILPNFPFVE